jgi:hypothetical protein
MNALPTSDQSFELIEVSHMFNEPRISLIIFLVAIELHLRHRYNEPRISLIIFLVAIELHLRHRYFCCISLINGVCLLILVLSLC